MEQNQTEVTPRYTGDYSDEDYREWHREFGPQAQLRVTQD